MGFLDSILEDELPEAKTDRLFAISTSAVTLESSLGLNPDGAAGVCIKPMESSRYEAARTEIEDSSRVELQEMVQFTPSSVISNNDIWVVLSDPDVPGSATYVQMVSQILMEQGFGTQLLAAVYRFKGDAAVYWIYNFKLGSYYPFVPGIDQQRNTSLEFRLRSLMEKELPVEKDEAKWYPMWGMPI